eukprot:3888577-Rhodomonas_salina.1
MALVLVRIGRAPKRRRCHALISSLLPALVLARAPARAPSLSRLAPLACAACPTLSSLCLLLPSLRFVLVLLLLSLVLVQICQQSKTSPRIAYDPTPDPRP